MKQVIGVVVGLVHVFAFTVCTYFAATDIESILVTGWICSLTGLISGITALVLGNRMLALVGFLTPVVAVALTFLELFVLELGPRRAALPFCIVFFLVQLLTNLVSFHSFLRHGEQSGLRQISISSMLLMTGAFALVFAVSRQLLQQEHNTLMLIALSFAGLTFVGATLTLYNLIRASFHETK